MSGSRRGRRHGWERERWKERQSGRKKERKRDRDGREKDRETGAGERKRRSDGENEKKLQKQKKFMEFYLVVLQSGYQRQGEKEKDRRRDGLGEREKDITRGDRNGPVLL